MTRTTDLRVTLPAGFAATQYPGYFWHVSEQRLYSLKTGELRPMRAQRDGPWYRNATCAFRPGYMISHKGKRRLIHLAELRAIKLHRHTIPVNLPENTGR